MDYFLPGAGKKPYLSLVDASFFTIIPGCCKIDKKKRWDAPTPANFPASARYFPAALATVKPVDSARRAQPSPHKPAKNPGQSSTLWKVTDMNTRLFSFTGGESGPWQVLDTRAIIGEPLAPAPRLDVVNGSLTAPTGAAWLLRGITSNERYVIRSEKNQLLAKQAGIGRPEATCATLIPIRKTAAWWALTQDERRQIFEETSRHTEIGLNYLPAIARRLHHCRDLAEPEPFDFLTWFEYAPADTSAFDDLLAALRATEEWRYIDREVEIRVIKAD
jgi:hypothetical protein